MIDCHSHLIFGMDDGSRSINESIKMIEQYLASGYTGTICTSHYYPGKYDFNKEKYIENFNLLDFYLKKNNINFQIFTGNEMFISANTFSDIKSNKGFTLANSKYVLIELPFVGEIKNLKDFAYELIVNGYIPILAHVERYKVMQENFNNLRELLDFGVLLQMNLSSLKDRKSKSFELAETLLKYKMISIVSTDSHTSDWRNPMVREYLEKLKIMVSLDYYNDIVIRNPKRIVLNEEIPVDYNMPQYLEKPIKKNGFLNNIKSLFNE